MDASEWMYVGEGGKHAVFGYRGSCSDERWNGRVLRISKDVLRVAHTSMAAASDALEADDKFPQVDPLYYIREVVKPLLRQYVDIPEVVPLEWEFLAALRDQALSEGVVPSSRLDQWTRLNDAMPNAIPVAHLIWNYRSFRGKAPCISMEIKPKAGYTAFSPLVDPEHRIKFSKTRFEILQQLHHNGFISKGWDEDGDIKKLSSSYNPLDLFSAESGRIMRALGQMVETPQNNLRVWMDDTPLLGIEMTEDDDEVYEKGLEIVLSTEDCRGLCGLARTAFFDALASCVTAVLLKEELLEIILRLQRLDAVDADGAILIHERLCELCGDNASELLDSPSPMLHCKDCSGHFLCESPFQMPGDCPALSALLQEVGSFSSKLDGSSRPTCADMDEARARCKRNVGSLTEEACVYLLKNWLLSLAMCDVSFFLALHPITLSADLDEVGIDPEDAEMQNGGAAYVVCCQTESCPGILVAHDKAFAYTLKVVDCDRKPATKLHKRREKEELIRLYEEEDT